MENHNQFIDKFPKTFYNVDKYHFTDYTKFLINLKKYLILQNYEKDSVKMRFSNYDIIIKSSTFTQFV